MNGKDVKITITFTQGEWRKIVEAIRLIEAAFINPGCDLSDPKKEGPDIGS